MAGCIDLTAGSIRRECVDRTLITWTCGVQTLLSIVEAVWAGRGETEISYWLVQRWAGKQAHYKYSASLFVRRLKQKRRKTGAQERNTPRTDYTLLFSCFLR